MCDKCITVHYKLPCPGAMLGSKNSWGLGVASDSSGIW